MKINGKQVQSIKPICTKDKPCHFCRMFGVVRNKDIQCSFCNNKKKLIVRIGQ